MLKKRLTRQKFKEYMANLPPCLVGIEACGGSHYWFRTLSKYGHTVKLMAPQFVKPYVKSNKNDVNDADGIAEAVSRPNMRFVPNKTIEQQDIQCILRMRNACIKERTALCNQLHGLLGEYGIVVAKSGSSLRRQLPLILEDAENELTPFMREELQFQYDHLVYLDGRLQRYDHKLKKLSKEDKRCQKLLAIEGVGPITALALIATIGDGKAFKSGREMSAYLGLVPKQCSSGNKTVLLGISKRGDKYLRTLLIHGGRAVVRCAGKKEDQLSEWINNKVSRSNKNKTAVAVANRNVRVAWAMLTRNEEYRGTLLKKGLDRAA